MAGRYTDESIARSSELAANLGKQLDTLYDANVSLCSTDRASRSKAETREDDFELALSVLAPQKLFSRIVGRQHHSYPNFKFSCDVKNPAKLVATLKKHCKKLDLLKRLKEKFE